MAGSRIEKGLFHSDLPDVSVSIPPEIALHPKSMSSLH